MIRPSLFLVATLAASAACGVIAARASRTAMRWAIHGTVEALYGDR